MKPFWWVIVLCFAFAFAGISIMGDPQYYAGEPWLPPQVMAYILGGIMVAVVWALCFRTQVEKLKVNVATVLVLVAMESILFLAMRAFARL